MGMSKRDDDSMDAERYTCGSVSNDVNMANVRCEVRQAILDRFALQPEVLKGKWRRKCCELMREYQHKRGMIYEHAEAAAFEDVLCLMWREKK